MKNCMQFLSSTTSFIAGEKIFNQIYTHSFSLFVLVLSFLLFYIFFIYSLFVFFYFFPFNFLSLLFSFYPVRHKHIKNQIPENRKQFAFIYLFSIKTNNILSVLLLVMQLFTFCQPVCELSPL